MAVSERGRQTAELPQHLAALDFANRIRIERGRLKRDLKAGTLSLADALEREEFATMAVGELLQFLPGRHAPERPMQARQISRARKTSGRLLAYATFSAARRVGALTERQRAALAAEWEAMRP